MRLGAPGAEKPVVRVDDTHYIDVSDVLSVVSGATRPETVLDSLAAESEPWDLDLEAAYAADLALTTKPTA